MNNRFKASCIAATVSDGYKNHCVIVGYTCESIAAHVVWGPEIENSIYIKDIFCGYDEPPNKEGFWVWEGQIQPVGDDQPLYFGKWRPATINDFRNLISD